MAEHTVPDTTAELDVSRVMHCMETTPEVQKLFEQVAATAEQLGYGRPEGIQVGGLSDAGILVAAGVPTLCGMGVRGEGAHTPEERAEVESLYERCELAACAAAGL